MEPCGTPTSRFKGLDEMRAQMSEISGHGEQKSNYCIFHGTYSTLPQLRKFSVFCSYDDRMMPKIPINCFSYTD